MTFVWSNKNIYDKWVPNLALTSAAANFTYTYGSTITDYEYRYRENNTGSWGSWESAGDTSTGENIPSLTSGTFYGFQVRAVNINGESEPSNTATGTAR